MTLARVLAAAVLALQLQPALLPLLCDNAGAVRATECDQPMSPEQPGPGFTGQNSHAPCPNPAFCGTAQTAVPGSLLIVVSVIQQRESPVVPGPVVHAVEAPAPFPPPPKA